MKCIFMGNPAFSARILQKIYDSGLFDTVAAVTSPDSQKGRGMKLQFSEVKKYALEKDMRIYQPVNLKKENFEDFLLEFDPDVIVVASFGMLLPGYVIDYPKFGCINVHASLLPEYRGAAPINRAIMDGKKLTGVTIMKMDRGLDTGDMISNVPVDILDNDDYLSLHDKLADEGGDLLIRTLPDIFEGKASYTPQNDALHTYAAKIREEERDIDWTRSAYEISCLVRGLSPDPCAKAVTSEGTEFKIYAAHPVEKSSSDVPCGHFCGDKKTIRISCKDGDLVITELQAAGGKRLKAQDILNGKKITAATVFK